MKKRHLLICILTLALAALLASACSGQKSAEEIAKENGATVVVTLDLAGGTSSGQTVRYLYLHEGAPMALPWEELGGKGIINMPIYEGYRFEGFYHGTKNEETGEISYGAKWDRSERFSEDTTLYARWTPPFVYRILNEKDEVIKEFSVNPGDALDTRDASAQEIEGYTFIAYFSDREFTDPWDPAFTHPGYPEGVTVDTATAENYVVSVYAQYVEGDYRKIRTASDFMTAGNYWLIGDENGVIDFEGATLPVIRQFSGKLVGNNVTIKNAVISRTASNAAENTGLFGRLTDATISDVTFENCTLSVELDRQPQRVPVVKVGFLAGSAERTALKNVSFVNCSVSISAADGVNCDYDETTDGYAGGWLWVNRDADQENGNTLTDVTGTVELITPNVV